jgi:hypothetical protein
MNCGQRISECNIYWNVIWQTIQTMIQITAIASYAKIPAPRWGRSRGMDAAKEFAIALENASREVIGLDIAKLTKTQLELYKSRAKLEQIKWVELIKKRDAVICAEARVEALKEAADRLCDTCPIFYCDAVKQNCYKVDGMCSYTDIIKQDKKCNQSE